MFFFEIVSLLFLHFSKLEIMRLFSVSYINNSLHFDFFTVNESSFWHIFGSQSYDYIVISSYPYKGRCSVVVQRIFIITRHNFVALKPISTYLCQALSVMTKL